MSANAPNGKENSHSHATRRKEERRDALREYIKGHHILEQIDKDLSRDISDVELPVVKFKTETRLKLLNKVLPDMKAVEVTGENGGAMLFQEITRRLVRPNEPAGS